jgi:hypothetical protein
MSAFDMKKIKEILDENKRLKNLSEELSIKIANNDFADEINNLKDEINNLKDENELLKKRLLRFETIEKQNIKDEIEKNKKEDILKARKQMNIDVNKEFGLPIKKENEKYGEITQHIIANGSLLQVDGKPANINSIKKIYLSGKEYDYGDRRIGCNSYGPSGLFVLWVPSTGMITHVFTKDQIKLPIKLHEMYNY